MLDRDEEKDIVDINQVYITLAEEHRNVFIQKIDNEIFMYRPIGRKEYRDIINEDRLNDFQKEEVICEVCTLYPENYDFEDCDAGVPTVLSQAIVKNSYMNSKKSIRELMRHYREEMFDLDNQVTCIINEAFPQFDIEEIEEWDMEKTAKYLSRAEWKIVNFRGGTFAGDIYGEDDEDDYEEEEVYIPQPEPVKKPKDITPEPVKDQPQPTQAKAETFEERQARLEKEGFFKKKERLTKEKLAELQRRFPEMQWSQDVLSNDNTGVPVDTTSPALRPGW